MKAIKQNWQMVAVCVAMLATALLLISFQTTLGNVTSEQPAPVARLTAYQFFATSTNQTTSGVYSTTTTATSTNITAWTDSNGVIDRGYMNIAGAKKVNVYFTRGEKQGGGNTGSTAFKLQVTPNGTDWYYFNSLTEYASSTMGSIAKTMTTQFINLLGTSTAVVSLDLSKDTFLGLRVVVVETTDGSHEAMATAEF